MADEERRGFERRAAGGDPEALGALKRSRCRAGECCGHEIPLISLTMDELRDRWNAIGALIFLEEGPGQTRIEAEVSIEPGDPPFGVLYARSNTRISWSGCRITIQRHEPSGVEVMVVQRQGDQP